MSNGLDIHIERWSAWSPGLESPEAWRQWAHSDQELPTEGSLPKLKFLPSLLRRRLSPVGKMALKVAYDCEASKDEVRTVFSSRHGEANVTIPLLNDIIHGQPLSPTKFSLSVHNTASGLYSITAENRAPATAIAARLDSFEMGFVEAATGIATGREKQVLLVYVDAPLKPPFDVLVDYEPPFAGAFLLGSAPTVDSLKLKVEGREQSRSTSSTPHFLAFMKFLLAPEASALKLATDRLTWSWSRVD